MADEAYTGEEKHTEAPRGHPEPPVPLQELFASEVYVTATDDLILLSRSLPDGNVIHVNTCDLDMLNRGYGMLHINFDLRDNRPENIRWVTFAQAVRAMKAFR